MIEKVYVLMKVFSENNVWSKGINQATMFESVPCLRVAFS